ncbi:hypothetical protein [Demequina muriae]|uniref:Membrane domain of glycerophosphoryl diester phosphodiesterase n=1 Tax=Demequina muriae TaxID=3051664 RepID=A0ABT8GHW3_9MICO|nr:hypothetical protein [Demequina sp. EGI L300058]MDN4481022.1 hypothetical protein [Demequina sp. EGI L300058]
MTNDDRRDTEASADAAALHWPSPGTPADAEAAQEWSAPGGAPPAPPVHPASPPAPVAGAAPGSTSPGSTSPGTAAYGAPGTGRGPAPHPMGAAPSFRSWQPGIIPLRPLSFGDFLTVPFKAMRFNRTVILGAPLLFTLVSTILMLVALWMVFTDPQLGLLNTTPTFSGISSRTIAMIVVSVLMMLLADVFSSSIIAPGVARAVLGERIGIPLAWRQVRRRLGSLLLLYVASSAAYTVLLLVAFSPLLVSLAAGDPSGVAIALTVVLFLLVMIPAGFVLTLGQGIARSMIVLEGISMVAALKRLTRLIRGRFWWSILILFVTAILINIVSSVLQYAGQFGAILVSLVAPENMVVLMVAFFVVYGLSYVISLVLVYSYLGSMFALLYIDLRMRHEGFDLDLARAAEERARR